ncbi:AAL023Wp [Eremothecium gossypii ATCC 10895]|uniref:AAL023Wp n=1 Tax=Eremothecium gossypii (strain ATCC 10895 / CBS 109.51 / FGSC 9923 / NRRL Y-1056) TaxID=284811 RepID=Q75EV3_EREGS|nr:AAL023Wp [Eremothecium gossypii ATCC 10895]AAS50343.2 AAL023Wp [Eremothecium gossypii ATCC 10895]
MEVAALPTPLYNIISYVIMLVDAKTTAFLRPLALYIRSVCAADFELAPRINSQRIMAKAVIFSDFDGTITWQDSNDFLADQYGLGQAARRRLFEGVIEGTTSFRDGFLQMLESIRLPFDQCVSKVREHVQLDPGFKDMYEWTRREGVPLVVISSGMRPLIEALLEQLLGHEALQQIEVIANEVDVRQDGTWCIRYRDESEHGHDKSRSIAACKQRWQHLEPAPVYFYCGDGISDLSAAKECDLLFAKSGKDLISFCKKQDVPFREFNTFDDVLSAVKRVVAGEASVTELQGGSAA